MNIDKIMSICLYVIDDLRFQMAKEHLEKCGRYIDNLDVVHHGKTDNDMNIISIRSRNTFDLNTFEKFSDHSYKISYDDMGFVEIKSLKHRTLANTSVISSALNIANELYVKEMKKQGLLK